MATRPTRSRASPPSSSSPAATKSSFRRHLYQRRLQRRQRRRAALQQDLLGHQRAGRRTDRARPAELRALRPACGQLRRDLGRRAIKDLIAPALKQGRRRTLKVWIEHEDSIYGTSIADRQKKLLEDSGVKVVGVGAHNFRAIDLTDSILRAKRRANPDVWIQTGYVPDGNLLLKTAREQGFKPAAMLWVGTGDTFETLEALGAEYLEGLLVVSYPRPDHLRELTVPAPRPISRPTAKYNRDPIAPQGMSAYVGLQDSARGVAAAGSTEIEKVRAAAAEFDKPLNTYATGFGVKFDEHNSRTRAPTRR